LTYHDFNTAIPLSDSNKDSDPLPTRVYTPESGMRHPVKMLADLWQDVKAGRELAWRLFVRDIKAQYRQTYFGYLWAFVPPLAAALTFIFLQGQGITNIDGTPIPYPAFVMIGTMLWQTFAEATMSPLQSVNAARPMLVKLNFPREAILMSGAYMVGFNTLIRLTLMAAVLLIWQIFPGLGVVAFPVAILALMLSGFGLGLMLLPIGTLYGDIGKGFPIILQFAMILTPVVYPIKTEGLAGWLTYWNPVVPAIETARSALTGGTFDYLPQLLFVIVAVIGLCLVGLGVFRLIISILIERMGG